MHWHARTSDRQGNAVTIVYHIPIPTVNNRASLSYRAALVGSGIGGTTSMTPGTAQGQITASELAQIQSGELYEYVEEFYTSPGEAATALRNRVDARYTELLGIVPARLLLQLTYWGFDRIVP